MALHDDSATFFGFFSRFGYYIFKMLNLLFHGIILNNQNKCIAQKVFLMHLICKIWSIFVKKIDYMQIFQNGLKFGILNGQ